MEFFTTEPIALDRVIPHRRCECYAASVAVPASRVYAETCGTEPDPLLPPTSQRPTSQLIQTSSTVSHVLFANSRSELSSYACA
jgi:hypothetical protein